MSYITIDTTTIEVAAEYDAIIIGGGTSGAFAGIACARRGLKTLIIEQYSALGGSATAGLVTPLMSSHINGYDGHCPLSIELVERLRKISDPNMNHLQFDPCMLKFVLEDMVTESGCDLLYHTVLLNSICENNKITYITVANKDGIKAYKALYFVDSTGDADLAVRSGVKYESGNADRINQPVSLRFEMGGIDFNAFDEFMKEIGFPNSNKYFAMNTPGMKEILQKAHEDGVLTKQDIKYFQAFGIPGRPNCMNFNCPELTTKENVVDAVFLTQKLIDGRKAILRMKHFLNNYIRGFENAYITDIADYVGIRESRRIDSEYNLTAKDLLECKKFDDAITASMYPIDIHGLDDVTAGLTYGEKLDPKEKYWEIPFRCMIAKGIDNLLVAGRCAGFDFVAQSAARVQLPCRAMGEAAGIGCAVAHKNKSAFKDIDGKIIRKEIKHCVNFQ